jgi:hypothetical protein
MAALTGSHYFLWGVVGNNLRLCFKNRQTFIGRSLLNLIVICT